MQPLVAHRPDARRPLAKLGAAASAGVLCVLGACGERELLVREFVGRSMGTSYAVTCVASADVEPAELERAVAAELAAVTARASTWDPTSELARFDAQRSTAPFAVSSELSELVARAISFAHLTGGAFDPTVLPLVRALGFAAEGGEGEVDEAALAAARERVGVAKLRVERGSLAKLDPELELDLSGIAPGDAVDRLGATLDALGARAWLIELGGEVRAHGTKLDGSPWLVGIEVPREGSEFGDELLRRVELSDRALATSGSYRRARAAGAQRVHHVVDPRTGRNATHETVSVTVLAPTCARADALATALLVLGADEGLRWLETQSDVEALFVRVDGERFEVRATPGFPPEPDR
ncbi:MAG: FAD:protein FMN transferase [Planctomycetes bacterium]|nr:FAD:protein FMN transferase [Planctomycetota bacterium]